MEDQLIIHHNIIKLTLASIKRTASMTHIFNIIMMYNDIGTLAPEICLCLYSKVTE